jgi:hypothetical protein
MCAAFGNARFLKRSFRLIAGLSVASLRVILLLGVGVASGQEGTTNGPLAAPGKDSERQPGKVLNRQARDFELQAITDMAVAVPPEFGADVLMRLVESGRITDRALKISLLDEAFALADSAEQPISREPVVGTDMDTVSGYLANAFFLGLDRLSLRSRAVDDMLPLDRARARSLFDEIGFPILMPLGCEYALAYDPRSFYEALDRMARNGFTSQEKLQGHEISLLARYVSGVRSHSQVAPVARLLGSLELSPTELGELASLFANALKQLRGDERSFAAATSRSGNNGLVGSLAGLIVRLDAKGVQSSPLLGSVREYLVANFGGLRCSGTMGRQAGRESLPETVGEFNRQFREALRVGQLSPINTDEIKDVRISPEAVDDAAWQSAEAKRIAAGFRRLRVGDGQGPFGATEKMTTMWSAQLTGFLNELESWNGGGEPEEVFFHEKSIVYEVLIDLIPSSRERSTALESFVRFLEQNYLHPSRIEWFWHARRLLDGYKGADDQPEVLLGFLNSRDSVLSLYARMEVWELADREPHLKASGRSE